MMSNKLSILFRRSIQPSSRVRSAVTFRLRSHATTIALRSPHDIGHPTPRRSHLTTKSNDGLAATVQAILRTPIGSIRDDIGWNEVEVALRGGFYQDDTGQISFLLLDRIFQEGHDNTSAERPQETTPQGNLQKVLHSATYQWRNTYMRSLGHSSIYMTPSELVRKIRAWDAQCDLVVDTAVYTMILEAAGSTPNDPENGVECAESLLQWMFQQAQQHQNYRVQPTTATVGLVMKAWVSSRRAEAPERIQVWLDRLHSSHEEGWLNVQPNTIVYNILLHALAMNKDAQRAQDTLQFMLQNDLGVSPDSASFSTVLLSYIRQESLDAMAKAEILLDQMLELYESGMESAKPNIISFTTVMNGYAHFGDGVAAQRLLHKVQALYRETRDPDFEPDAAAFNTVMTAWTIGGRPDFADELLQDALNGSLIEPDEKSFHAVLSGWARIGEPEKAEALLQQMHQLYASGVHDNPPSVSTYNIVLDSWAKSRRKDAWQRAHDILRHMEDLSTADIHIKPNDRTWNTVFNCFRYCGQRDFHHAFKLLDDFFLADKEGRVDRGPDLRTWNTLLAACRRNTKDDYRLHQIWELMKEGQGKPDVITYNTIFSCYCRYAKHQKDARDGFERILAEMRNDDSLVFTQTTYLVLIDAWVAFGEIDKAEEILKNFCRTVPSSKRLTANVEPFHRVLLGWSSKRKPRRVESIVLLMEELHQCSGFQEVKPTVETYNILLHAWARSCERNIGERADLVFREMGVRGITPNRISYNSAINAWAESGDPVATTKIETLVLEMILSGRPDLIPDHITYNTWMKAILNDNERHQQRRMKELLKTMKIHNLEPSDYIQSAINESLGGDLIVL